MTMTVRARVKNGRLTVDEPTDLPEGTEVELSLVDGEDEQLDAEDSAALQAALERADDDVRAGRVIPGHELLARLRRGAV